MSSLNLIKDISIAGLMATIVVVFAHFILQRDAPEEKMKTANDSVSQAPPSNKVMEYLKSAAQEKERLTQVDERLEKMIAVQEKNTLNTALLYEELDKLQRAVSALSEVSEQHRQGVDAQEPLTEPEKEQIFEEHLQATQQFYRDALTGEQADPAWRAQVEQQLSDYLQATDNKMQAEHIQCKYTLCELSFRRGSGVANEEAMAAFDNHFQWPGEMAMVYDPKTGTGTAFLAREGHTLPALADGER